MKPKRAGTMNSRYRYYQDPRTVYNPPLKRQCLFYVPLIISLKTRLVVSRVKRPSPFCFSSAGSQCGFAMTSTICIAMLQHPNYLSSRKNVSRSRSNERRFNRVQNISSGKYSGTDAWFNSRRERNVNYLLLLPDLPSFAHQICPVWFSNGSFLPRTHTCSVP